MGSFAVKNHFWFSEESFHEQCLKDPIFLGVKNILNNLKERFPLKRTFSEF